MRSSCSDISEHTEFATVTLEYGYTVIVRQNVQAASIHGCDLTPKAEGSRKTQTGNTQRHEPRRFQIH